MHQVFVVPVVQVGDLELRGAVAFATHSMIWLRLISAFLVIEAELRRVHRFEVAYRLVGLEEARLVHALRLVAFENLVALHLLLLLLLVVLDRLDRAIG